MSLGCRAGGQPQCRYCVQADKAADVAGDAAAEAAYALGCDTPSPKSLTVELTWQGAPSHFHAAVSFRVPRGTVDADTGEATKRSQYCHLNRVVQTCGGVVISPAVTVDAATRQVRQTVTFDALAEGTVYSFFAQNVDRTRRRGPPRAVTERAFLEAAVFARGDGINGNFLGSFKAPAYDTVENYDSIAPSLNGDSVRGKVYVDGSRFVRLWCLSTKQQSGGSDGELQPSANGCARYFDMYGYRNARRFENCPPLPEPQCGGGPAGAPAAALGFYCSRNVKQGFYACPGGYRVMQRCPANLVCQEYGPHVACTYPPAAARAVSRHLHADKDGNPLEGHFDVSTKFDSNYEPI